MTPFLSFFSGTIGKALLGLGAAALLAFMLGRFVSSVDQKGYDRGYNAAVLQQRLDADRLVKEAQERAQERERRADAARLAAEIRAKEAEDRANDALTQLINSDPEFAVCEAQPFPDAARRFHPPSL